jgi:hypothetical protein
LKNEHLWCFSHLHQTDKEEFSYSRSIALKELGNLKNIGGFALAMRDAVKSQALWWRKCMFSNGGTHKKQGVA